MAKNNWNIKQFKVIENIGKVTVEINFNPKNIIAALDAAQYELDTQFMNYMVQYMPMDTGALINTVRARSAALAGHCQLYVATPPYGPFLYHGVVMVDSQTGSPWARKGAKKVVTAKPLTYSNPKAKPYWDQETIKNHKDQLIELTKNAFRKSKGV